MGGDWRIARRGRDARDAGHLSNCSDVDAGPGDQHSMPREIPQNSMDSRLNAASRLSSITSACFTSNICRLRSMSTSAGDAPTCASPAFENETADRVAAPIWPRPTPIKSGRARESSRSHSLSIGTLVRRAPKT